MTSVLTGDIVESKKIAPGIWLRTLKSELNKQGESPKQWEIYRGDSFQVEIKNPVDALKVAIRIKAAIKSHRKVDVRLAIGIGDKTYAAKSITESNGSAFVHSGGLVETLKVEKLSMAVRSNNVMFNDEMNLYLRLALVIMDRWTTHASEAVYTALKYQYPAKSQKSLGKILGIRQNAVSTRLKRASYHEIMALISMYELKVNQLIVNEAK